ncbi:MAG: phosphohydrolase [Actinomycetota bacterium]|nr:phosphohydrolase [Actinomycetota bacterium]
MVNATDVARARLIATQAHEGQTDKAGVAYIGHPARIAARVAGDPAAEVVAWLHDVVEDCDHWTLDRLRAEGIPADLVAAVDAISKRPGEASDDYYARVAANPVALKVKYADLADNSDPERLAKLDPATRERLTRKYAHAREVLASLAD